MIEFTAKCVSFLVVMSVSQASRASAFEKRICLEKFIGFILVMCLLFVKAGSIFLQAFNMFCDPNLSVYAICRIVGSVYTGVDFCKRLCGVSVIRRYLGLSSQSNFNCRCQYMFTWLAHDFTNLNSHCSVQGIRN